MELPGLATAGNRLVEARTGRPVVLRGVNRSGMEYASLAGAGITREEIALLADEWNCRVLRLPFSQEWVLGRGEEYLAELDAVIGWAAGSGMYTILDLQWLDCQRRVAPLPDMGSVEAWRILAARYGAAAAVLFDLFNEPHDCLPDDPHPLLREDGTYYPASQRTVSPAEWRPWAARLIREVRAAAPETVALVSGVNWGYDLCGMDLGEPNVVYSTHVYRNKGEDWEEAFGALARRAPVFAAEWGGWDGDVGWGQRLARYFDELGIGWTAWSWSDEPYLQRGGAPTAFGELVREALAATSGAL